MLIRLSDLKTASAVCVHSVRTDEFITDLRSSDIAILESSISDVKADEDLFALIASTMKFPDYFGNNWDAFDECLTDMEWLPAKGYILILRDAICAWSSSPYTLGKLVTSWLEAAEYWGESNTPFHLIFVM